MSGDHPFALAVSTAEPDLEFASLDALARHIAAVRARAPLTPDGPPELKLTSVRLSRGGLPAGAAVSVRILDGLCKSGHLIGYALLPPQTEPGAAFAPANRLMTAFLAVTRELERRAA